MFYSVLLCEVCALWSVCTEWCFCVKWCTECVLIMCSDRCVAVCGVYIIDKLSGDWCLLV